jgi:hypothetical protein
MKAVLKALLTRASKVDGTTPIKARLDIVAEQAEVSEKSVRRTLVTLRSAGWLEDASTGRSEYGVFTSKRYRFSPELCAIVGLPTKENPKAPQEAATLSDGAVYVDLNFKEDHREILRKNQNPVTLPAELEAIVELGVKATGVCKLRGMASAKGHNLADVFTVAKKRLQEIQAKGGRVFRYLAAMIDNPKATDYAARAALIDHSYLQEQAAQQTKSRSQKYAYKRFAAGPGITVRIFDGIAEVIRDGNPIGSIAGRDMEKVYDDIESGKLREIIS